MSSTYDLYMEKILEAAFFENWLRFYFLQEEPPEERISNENKIYYKIPPEALIRIKAENPHYMPMAEFLNGKEAQHPTSIEAIRTFAPGAEAYSMQAEEMEQDAKRLEAGIEEIHMWLQISAEMLDSRLFSFPEWVELFNKWKKAK